MSKYWLAALMAITVLPFVGNAQDSFSSPPPPNGFYSMPRSYWYQQTATPDTDLQHCQEKLQKWKDWSQENIPKHNALLKEYDALTEEKESLELENKKFNAAHNKALVGISTLGIAIGFGVGLLAVAFRAWRKIRPSTPKKQLMTLILCSLWIITVGIVLIGDSTLSKHPINLLVSVFVYSLPAILFGGITLWWLKRDTV